MAADSSIAFTRLCANERAQRLLKALPLDENAALVVIGGADSNDSQSCRAVISYLFGACGLVGDLMDAHTVPGECFPLGWKPEYDEIVLVASHRSGLYGLYLDSSSTAGWLTACVKGAYSAFDAAPGAEVRVRGVQIDVPALEMSKIQGFLAAIAPYRHLYIPVGLAPLSPSSHVAVSAEVEMWPLVQSHALEGVGRGGFLSSRHTLHEAWNSSIVIEDITASSPTLPSVRAILQTVDAYFVKSALGVGCDPSKAQWDALASQLASHTPPAIPLAAEDIVEPFQQLFQHGQLQRNATLTERTIHIGGESVAAPSASIYTCCAVQGQFEGFSGGGGNGSVIVVESNDGIYGLRLSRTLVVADHNHHPQAAASAGRNATSHSVTSNACMCEQASQAYNELCHAYLASVASLISFIPPLARGAAGSTCDALAAHMHAAAMTFLGHDLTLSTSSLLSKVHVTVEMTNASGQTTSTATSDASAAAKSSWVVSGSANDESSPLFCFVRMAATVTRPREGAHPFALLDDKSSVEIAVGDTLLLCAATAASLVSEATSPLCRMAQLSLESSGSSASLPLPADGCVSTGVLGSYLSPLQHMPFSACGALASFVRNLVRDPSCGGAARWHVHVCTAEVAPYMEELQRQRPPLHQATAGEVNQRHLQAATNSGVGESKGDDYDNESGSFDSSSVSSSDSRDDTNDMSARRSDRLLIASAVDADADHAVSHSRGASCHVAFTARNGHSTGGGATVHWDVATHTLFIALLNGASMVVTPPRESTYTARGKSNGTADTDPPQQQGWLLTESILCPGRTVLAWLGLQGGPFPATERPVSGQCDMKTALSHLLDDISDGDRTSLHSLSAAEYIALHLQQGESHRWLWILPSSDTCRALLLVCVGLVGQTRLEDALRDDRTCASPILQLIQHDQSLSASLRVWDRLNIVQRALLSRASIATSAPPSVPTTAAPVAAASCTCACTLLMDVTGGLGASVAAAIIELVGHTEKRSVLRLANWEGSELHTLLQSAQSSKRNTCVYVVAPPWSPQLMAARFNAMPGVVVDAVVAVISTPSCVRSNALQALRCEVSAMLQPGWVHGVIMCQIGEAAPAVVGSFDWIKSVLRARGIPLQLTGVVPVATTASVHERERHAAGSEASHTSVDVIVPISFSYSDTKAFLAATRTASASGRTSAERLLHTSTVPAGAAYWDTTFALPHLCEWSKVETGFSNHMGVHVSTSTERKPAVADSIDGWLLLANEHLEGDVCAPGVEVWNHTPSLSARGYIQYIDIDEGSNASSRGMVQHAVFVVSGGHVHVWPVSAASVTATPFMTVRVVDESSRPTGTTTGATHDITTVIQGVSSGWCAQLPTAFNDSHAHLTYALKPHRSSVMHAHAYDRLPVGVYFDGSRHVSSDAGYLTTHPQGDDLCEEHIRVLAACTAFANTGVSAACEVAKSGGATVQLIWPSHDDVAALRLTLADVAQGLYNQRAPVEESTVPSAGCGAFANSKEEESDADATHTAAVDSRSSSWIVPPSGTCTPWWQVKTRLTAWLEAVRTQLHATHLSAS